MPDLHLSQLAPGLRVVTRGHHHLQIGLYAGRRVLLPRTPLVEDVLACLLDRRPVTDDPAASAVLDRLTDHGLLVPPGQAQDSSAGRVAVLGELRGVDLGPELLLGRCGLGVTRWPTRAAVVLVLSTGEPDRDLLDPLVRAGTHHLVVRLVDGGAVLGPFVSPGVTACLRCTDAHRTVEDPDHVPVTARYVRASRRTRRDGVPDVADPALALAALAWAVRDVAAHLAGKVPSTWSRTLTLGSDPARRDEQEWRRHPDCGCCWTGHAPSSGTMGV